MAIHRFLPLLGLVGLASCDLDGEFLFSKVDGLPSSYEITSEDGGPLVPAVIRYPSDIQSNTIYGELAPSNNSLLGGATFTFLGTGGDVCIWVDPETAAWTTAISNQPSSGAGAESGLRWTYPDNPFDDGDIDLSAGLSVYYTGSPDVLGDFQVAYEDSLGNDIPISLAGCPNDLSVNAELVSGGKGHPEFCTLSTVGAEGVSHTVVLRSFSIPVDDSRLGFGLLLARGSCNSLYTTSGLGSSGGGDELGADPDPLRSECLIRGESLEPLPIEGEKEDYAPVVGYENVQDRIWAGVTEFEEAYCFASDIRTFCREEARAISASEEGLRCDWELFDAEDYSPDERCFCGDPNDIPDSVAF